MSQIDDFLDGKAAPPAAPKVSAIDAFLGEDKPKAPGLARGAADSLIAFGSGVTSSVQSLANVAGADNPVSQGLGKATKFLTDMDSPERKAEKQNRAATIKKAEESGSTWEEVKAYGGAFAEAPLDTTLNALGSSVPTLAAAFLTGGTSVPAQVAARALPKVIGVAQGTGAVKGQIYEAVEQEHLKDGKTPEEAAALAAKAQAYDGKNAGQIALGGVLGGVAAGIGAEAAIRRFVGGKVAGEVGKDAAIGIGKAAGLGVLKETPVEMLQGGQERVASNLALQNEGFDTPTWQGVAGQAALEGLASAPMGAGFGMLDARGGPTVNPNTAAEPPAQPPAPAEQPPAPFVNPDAPVAAEPPPVVTPSQSMGIDPNAGAISRVAAAAVDGPASMEMATQQANAAIAAQDNPEAGAPADQPVPIEDRPTDELRMALRNAQDPAIRKTIGEELQRRREAPAPTPDLFAADQGAANVSNTDAAGALAAGTGGTVGADAVGGGPDAGLLEAAAGQRAAGTAGAPAPSVQESVAAPVPGQQLDPALTKEPINTKAKVGGLKELIARNKAAKPNVQDQPQGTAPAAAPAPAEAIQAPPPVGSDGVAQPGAAPAGNTGVEGAGVASKKQEFKVEGADPHTVSYAQRPDGRLVRTINYPDGQSSADTLVTDKKGDETWVSNDRYAKGEFYPKQLSSADAEQAIREDMAGKPVAPTPSPTTTEPANAPRSPEAAQAVETTPQGREETALLSDSVSTEPNLEAAKALLARQKAATGNAVAEGKLRKELRDLAAKTPETDTKTMLALDTAATRLGMGEGRLKGLEFKKDEAPAAPAVAAPAPDNKPDPAVREKLMAIAKRLGVTVNTANGGFKAGGGAVDIPAEDAQVEGALSPNHVAAHELGHAAMQKRGISFQGHPIGRIKQSFIPNWDALVEASKAFRPAVWASESLRIKNHARKPNEVIADAIGSVYLGLNDVSLLEPMMKGTGTTVFDLGLEYAPAPSQQAEAPAEPQEITHNGTRIYRTRAKLGDEVKTMWAVESPENKARRAAGERTLGGDTLHDTIEQAKAAADREAKQYAERKAFAEQQDKAERARKEADEARKASNRGKSIFERRKDAILDGDTKLPASAGLGNTTRRNAMQMAVEQGRAVVERQVDDTAAKKRDQEAIDRVRRAGYMLGLSNENIPVVKAGLEAQARLKANDYKKPEYRVYAGSEPTGGFFEITKIEYEYAQELMAQKAAAPAAPAPEPAAQADEFLPEGWTKSINGYTKRPVYRMEQGGGQPFAVVTQTEGMAYEVQIRHGDKQLTTSTQRGALSEVLAGAKAELAKMTQAASVTHQDPGEKPEAATKGVVNDSLKTAAKNEDTKPSEMRKWLLAEIDKELLQSPDRADYDEAVKRMGEKDAISMYVGNGPLGKNAETGFITFDVPGDGKFKVRNSVRGLLEFRKTVNSSLGFKDGGQKPLKPEQNDGVQGGSGGQMAAITNMIEEGDFEAARDYAEAVGIKLEDVKVPRGERKPQWDQFLKDGTVPPPPNTAPMPEKKTAAQENAEKLEAEEAERRRPKDTGWNMAGTGYAGKRYTGRNITLADGRQVVARIYENAGNYDEVDVKVDGARKFTVRDSFNAQDKADAFIKTLTATGEKVTDKLATPDKMTPRQFDDWIRQRATIQTEQFRGDRNHGGGDDGVGYIHLSGQIEGAGLNWAGVTRGGPKDNRDSRLIFRTDDNKIVWYDDASQQVYEVLKDDARLEITRPEPTPKQARDPQEITVTVDGSDYTVTFDEPLATISNQAFQDNLDEYGTPGVAKAEFRKLRAQAQDGGAVAPAATGARRDPTKVSMFNPYNDGDIVTIDGQDWTVKTDTPGWYLTTTGNWRGQHPTIRNVKAMADLIREVEQAAEAKPAAAQAETPKLTQAEAKELMEWQDLGQKDGIKTHILTFYESKADKDAKRGRMTVATVSKEVDSKTWVLESNGEKYAMLGFAKKRAEEAGMARAVADGFVEPAATPMGKYDAEARAYGYQVAPDGKISKGDKALSPVVKEVRSRLRVEAPDGKLLFSGATTPEAFGEFLRSFWGAEKTAQTTNDRDTFTLERLNPETDRMEPVTFQRGETVKIAAGQRPYPTGVITGISHAERKFRVDGNEYGHDFGYAYKADFDELAQPRQEVDASLNTLEQRLNEGNAIQSEGFIRSAKEVIERNNLGDYAKDRMAQLARRAADVSKSVLDKMRAAKAEKEQADAQKRAEDQAKAAEPKPPIEMTMDEWKAVSKDFKGMIDGKRTVMRDGGMRFVTIIPSKAAESKTPTIDAHNATMAAVREGKATAEQFKASFESLVASKDAVIAELSTKTKADLLQNYGGWMRYSSDTKADIVSKAYQDMVGFYVLGESLTYGMGKGAYEAAVRQRVEATDDAKLQQYVKDLQAEIAEAQAIRAERAAAIENPQTLSDFREAINVKVRDGMTRKEAFLTLTPEQRIKYDTLEAEGTREARETRKRALKTQVRAADQTTGGQIIATKHTKNGYDLFVVQLSDRLSREDYQTVLASAKKLGGWYSAFRGNGAVPGFQFKDRANADAFLALAGGDTAAAQEQVAQRRDAFEDDRSQTAVERLRAMADKLEAQAAEVEGRERKTNTARRARFASAALNAAAADKAKAKTMRNIADGIEAGKAKFLDEVRTKSQVDMLTSIVDTAKGNELRAKYPSYADQEKRKGEPPTAETADFAEFPSYGAFRSDLATLGRQLLEVDGTKKLGQRLMSVADDVTDAYLEFAKANFRDVSQFGRGDSLADFASKDEAERAIKRSGLTGKAIVLPIKRGQNRVILSPSEAIGRGVWQGDGDKRITLTVDFGNELVEAIGRRGNKANRLTVPWQFQSAYDRRKALARIGIETPSEFRSALREFINLKEQAVANRTRELELQMVGRKADGLDFFPTSAEVADQMVDAADLSPDMAVLEPSAGMGHLADRIREAGAEPDVIEISPDRRELLEEKGYHLADVDDFMQMEPRKFFTYGDVFRAPDGTEGIMRGGNSSMGSDRVMLVGEDGRGVGAGFYNRSELVGVRHRGSESGYDRIIMNPPFSNRRDAEHVRHAYDLLKPGGRIVAIMGEGVFFGQDKKAQDFRDWLDSVGGTSEKLPEGSFMDPSLPVNTAVNARMVVIDKPAANTADVVFSQSLTPVAPGQGVSRQEAEEVVEKALDALGMRGVVTPQVVQNTLSAGLGATPPEVVPSGGNARGQVYLFLDGIADQAEAFRVVFHELFHLGLSQSVKPAEYTQTMLQFLRDPMVREYANRWKQSADGKNRLRTMPMNNWHALAVEEALADIAEEMNAERGGIGTKDMQGWVKRTIAWLADTAQKWGLPAVARRLRGMTYTQAEAFVQATMLKARTGAPTLLPDTRFAQADGATGVVMRSPRELVSMATDQLKMTLTAPGKLSWWSKTVGTMYNLAERHPAFKPVFNAAQSFIDDVSYYATDAADMAPKMLPKLENWRDIAKSPISAEDNKAIEAPINEGTLLWARDESGRPVKVAELEAQAADMTADQKARRLLRNDKINEGVLRMWQGLPQEQYEKLIESRYQSQMLTPGVVWTDAELKAIWKLNDAQIGLYREVRAAIDKSLDNLAKSDLVRFVGKDGAGIKDAIMEAGSVDEAALMARDYFIGLAEAEPDRAEMLLATANGIMDRADKVTRLKEQGYAPLSRFGKYTVDVVTEEGRQYFGLFESMREANQMAARMRGEFGKDAVSQGTLSDESFKLFQGITPETLELFGNMLGLSDTGDTPQDQAFQAYLKLTKNNRSAMKRLIQRKGILGYSQDVGRVLANFVYSNARQTASALHIGDLTDAINAIPQGQGEVKDMAVRLGEYIKNPQEEAQAFRGLLFAQYLGGNISSAIINALQPFQVSFPYLSQFGGVKQAGAEMLRATREYATGKKNYEPDLAKALKNAEDDGTVSPQEVFQLMAQAKGAGTLRSGDGTVRGELLAKGGNAWAKTAMAWGKVFGVAEQFNRRTTFIAAYRIAKAQKMADPAAFAKKAVQETQFIYSKANRPQWARGAIGATIFTFKTYSISYLELLHRMATQGGPEGKRAALLAVAVLLLMGGAGGLPFMEDGEDIADTIAQVMGYNFSSKQAKQELLEELFGEAAAQFIERGISGVAGVPIDVSGRFGMGNLVPGTGAFLQRNSNARDVLEVLGPAGDLARRGQESVAAFLKGDLKQSAYALSPRAIYNMAKGGDMLNTGMYRDDKGFKVIEATTGEGVLKAIGFQPNSVAKVQESNYLMQRQKDFYNATAQSIRAKWARGLFEKDEDMVAEAREAINAWNEKNPDQRMSPNMPAIWKRVREMAKDKDQRIADTAPKAMRQQFREETARVREAL